MLKIVSIDEEEDWNEIINLFIDRDIYLDRDYLYPLSKYLDCEILLLFYENGKTKICEAIQINDIEKNNYFKGKIESNKYFDIETPYGYGGIIFEDAKKEDFQDYYFQKTKWAFARGIISEFIRFNPLLGNFKYVDIKSTVSNIKSTVYIDLRPEDELMLELSSKNRNMVRKAQREGIEIVEIEPFENLEEVNNFIQLYIETMKRNKAEDFYYFSREYFYNFLKNMKDKCKLFCAKIEGKTIASSIIIFNNKNIHYYLSGSDRNYMNLAPNNLLLFKISIWAYNKGYKKFHLGGGVSDNDTLFLFKKQFNPRGGVLPYYIGRVIFDNKKFDYLVGLRKKYDSNFDLEKPFLIKYRQE